MSDPTVSLMPGSHATSYSNISLQNIFTKSNLIHGAKTEFTHAKTKFQLELKLKHLKSEVETMAKKVPF